MDILVGGSGFDTFVVGDFFVQDYYLSQSTIADDFGDEDAALIVDFTRGNDQLSLGITTNPYVFNFYGFGLDIYADIGFLSSGVDEQDDLLARILFNAPLDLPVPPPSPKFASLAVSEELIEPEIASSQFLSTDDLLVSNSRQLESIDVDSERALALTTVDEVIEFALAKNAEISEANRSPFFGSSFTFDTIPDELTDIFAPVGTLV